MPKSTAAPQQAMKLLNLDMREIVCGAKDAGSEKQDPPYERSVRRTRLSVMSKDYALAGAGFAAARTADFLFVSH